MDKIEKKYAKVALRRQKLRRRIMREGSAIIIICAITYTVGRQLYDFGKTGGTIGCVLLIAACLYLFRDGTRGR
jgi:hypothetical protein